MKPGGTQNLEPSQVEFAFYLETAYDRETAARYRDLVSNSEYLKGVRALKTSIHIHVCKVHLPKRNYYRNL